MGLDVYRALLMLARAQNGDRESSASYQDKPRRTTPDELADNILRQELRSRFPQLFEYQKAEAKREQELVESLKT